MRRRRGSTLVEVLFTTSLTVVVLGAATLVFLQAMDGAYETTASADMAVQAELAGGRIENLISQAISAQATSFGGKPALKLTMPLTEGPRDNLGINRTYDRDWTHPRLKFVYGTGKRVWLIQAMPATDLKGMWVTAERSDDATPTAADIDWSFGFTSASNAAPRYPLGMDLAFSVSPAIRVVTVTMTLTAGTTSQGVASNAGPQRTLSFSRTTRYREANP